MDRNQYKKIMLSHIFILESELGYYPSLLGSEINYLSGGYYQLIWDKKGKYINGIRRISVDRVEEFSENEYLIDGNIRILKNNLVNLDIKEARDKKINSILH